jgi:hypothetical protein
MRAVLTILLGITLASSAALGANVCSATENAPETIHVRKEPGVSAQSLQIIPRQQVSSLVREDMFSGPGGDWLKIRGAHYDGWVSAREIVCRVPSQQAEDIIAKQAAEVLEDLESKNLPELARTVHPVKGLRFSPYATVDSETDIVLTASQLENSLQDPANRTWGADDGSGAPIRLSFLQYFQKFVYDRDFAHAPRVTYNIGNDNTRKAWEQYPDAIVADYRLPETGNKPEEHLLLVFEQYSGKWYLRGIIHGGWTI